MLVPTCAGESSSSSSRSAAVVPTTVDTLILQADTCLMVSRDSLVEKKNPKSFQDYSAKEEADDKKKKKSMLTRNFQKFCVK